MLGLKLLGLMSEYEKGEAFGELSDARPVDVICAEIEEVIRQICLTPNH